MTDTAEFEIAAYVNVSTDHFFAGYRPLDPIALVATFTVLAADELAAAEVAFTVGNRMATAADGFRWPSEVRSMSKGDMAAVKNKSSNKTTFLAVAGVGWNEIVEPANRIVQLAGSNASW